MNGVEDYSQDLVISADGTTIGVRRFGRGPGLVLLHGGVNAAKHMARLGERLADAYTIYLPDRRGRGTSDYAGSSHREFTPYRWTNCKEGDMVSKENQGREKYRVLVERILDGPGTTSREERAQAFRNAELPAALHALIEKVVTTPTRVTDADFAAAKASGASEDQIFELVISAALGQSTRMYDAGLAALAEAATEGKGADDAS